MYLKKQFSDFGAKVLNELENSEHISLSLVAEQTTYTRYSQSKIRQTTFVDQAQINISLIINGRNLDAKINFDGENQALNIKNFLDILKEAKEKSKQLPVSNTVVLPLKPAESIQEKHSGQSLSKDIHNDILALVKNEDFVGMLVSGSFTNGFMNSAGASHWFESNSFYLDYSIYSKEQKAVKSCYAGNKWNQDEYKENISKSLSSLNKLSLPTQKIKPGKYKTYLAPAAVQELIQMMSWGALSARSYKLGFCGLKKVYDGEVKLSEKFSLKEDFKTGFSPRFNSFGEVAPQQVPLIEKGILKSFLVSTLTAKEHTNLKTNFANSSEHLRSPVVSKGTIEDKDILKQIGTGLYVSNFHYLNWSDMSYGRITGMTRFACFWVEDAKIKGPINNLRFDETLFNIFGKNLIGLTKKTEIIPKIMSYERRHIGAIVVPGILVDNFSYNL